MFARNIAISLKPVSVRPRASRRRRTETLQLLTISFIVVLTTFGAANAQSVPCLDQGTWTSRNFTQGNIDLPILLTDGRVMVQYLGGGSGNAYQDWYALSPDNNGNYANGTWSTLASLHNVNPQYGPYGFASEVLADGKVIVQGGEFNIGQQWTNMSAIFDPSQNQPIGIWSQLSPPPGFTYIGDAPSVVLASNTYMVAACGTAEEPDCAASQDLTYEQALYNEATQQWTIIQYPPNNKFDPNSEEGWTLLPGGQLLTVDITGGSQNSEVYDPSSNVWTLAGATPDPLYGDFPTTGEIGPAVLMSNGNVFATGAIPHHHPLPSTSAHTAIYDPAAQLGQRWTKGPDFPLSSINNEPIGMGDESAVLLPDGNVLLAAHDRSDSNPNYYLYEYIGTSGFYSVQAPPSLTSNAAYEKIKMLVLPNGTVVMTDSSLASPSSAYYIYAPNYGVLMPDPSWRPNISIYPSQVTLGQTYSISGTQFNGMSQTNMFGDEKQNASNYPLVQITDSAHNVFYARTHDHSTMGVATGRSIPTSTKFDVPTGLALG